MWHWHACIWIATLLAAADGACAPVRIGALEVRAAQSSAACFTISQAEEQRHGAPDFDAISVIDPATPKLALWSMAMPRERTFAVGYQMCVPYAGRVPALPRTSAAPLAQGRIYEATMVARAPAPGAPRLYRARFCLRGEKALQVTGALCPSAPSP